jgi:hypothetical protein
MVPSRAGLRILFLVVLAIGAYLPATQLPFIADDYHQIPIARADALAGWAPLWHDALLRTRFTYMFLSATLDRWFGFEPMPFYLASIALHVACVLLLYSICAWRAIPRAVAFWGATFFAVQEGHQEAVMWLAASYDLIVFAFGMGALVAWTKWLRTRHTNWYATSLIAFLIAAASKETFFVFALLMLIVTVWEERKKGLAPALLALSPFLLISVAYLVFIWMTRFASGSGAPADSRFAFSGMWITVFFRGLWDLLLPFGLASAAILLWLRRKTDRWLIAFALLWIVLGIVPHSFLTYMPRLASRHTYLASAGLAILFGIAMKRLSKHIPTRLFRSVILFVLAINLEILWVKKTAQFKERAEPTELLKAAVFQASGPITVDCITVPDVVAVDALKSFGSAAILRNQGPKNDHCFAIEYKDHYGAVVRINRRIGKPHGTFY